MVSGGHSTFVATGPKVHGETRTGHSLTPTQDLVWRGLGLEHKATHFSSPPCTVEDLRTFTPGSYN